MARDGEVLADNKSSDLLEVHYRYLQQPPDVNWLANQVRRRLPCADRRNKGKRAAAEAQIRYELDTLHERLAGLCAVDRETSRARRQRVQRRVEGIAQRVNHRAAIAPADSRGDLDASLWDQILDVIGEFLTSDSSHLATPRVIVAEELAYHVLADDLPPEIVAEIRQRAERYAGVRVRRVMRRTYPFGSLAAHTLGYTSAPEGATATDAKADSEQPGLVGRAGVELAFDAQLRGAAGQVVESLRHNGEVLGARTVRQPVPGRDVRLTLDPLLQRAAEALLDSALERRDVLSPNPSDAEAGGAIVVMDVSRGDVLAAASAPRFTPDAFARADDDAIARWLTAEGHPMFDRVSQMAIPPGSVFKAITAAALLETGAADAREQFHCQGYLRRPDRQRCAIFVRHGVGHGPVDLRGALAVSCNVYFYEAALKLGPTSLVDWARRFGFGQPTRIELPGEASGHVPSAGSWNSPEGSWRKSDVQDLAIGQGQLTATPLQIVRAMAILANGGRPVRPRLTLANAGDESRAASLGLQPQTLAALREGLERSVAAPEGTAHATVAIDGLRIAGKTGTAETGAGQPPHAWFAGYAPAEAPRVAFVVVLEHAGAGGLVAGPIARRLILRMRGLGYFSHP